MESIAVDAAIKKGRRQLWRIPLFIMFGSIIIAPLIVSLIKDGSIWVPICGFLSFTFAIVAPFLYYFFMLPRWRIWAFSNVRNVHELKQRAILGQIYPKDNSLLWRFEIKTAEQKKIIDELDLKFDRPDIFEDDHLIPFETSYELSTNGQLLLISNDGITTKKNGFHSWKDIQNEHLFWVSAGKASYYGLSYEIGGQVLNMPLRDLTDLNSIKVDHVLRTYRGRYESTKQKRQQ